MSWNDTIQNTRFSIQTGDGQIFYPLWLGSVKNREFNINGYDFINVSGTLYERKQPKGANYTLNFYFTGDNFINDVNAFEVAANDRRAWTVTHPIYGTIIGQPTSIGRSDDLNISNVTVDFWESINVDYPNANFDVKDNTMERKQDVLSTTEQSFGNSNAFESEDIVKTKGRNTQISASFQNVITENPSLADQLFSEYQALTSTAQKAADKLLDDQFNSIKSTQDLLNLPARIEASVTTRLDAFIDCYSRIKTPFTSVADKVAFESVAGSLIANYADASVNPIEGDYVTVPQVQTASNNLIDLYNDYLLTLDGAIVDIYDVDNAYTPDASVQMDLAQIVSYTIANLYDLAFNAQQERIIYTDRNTNLFLLVHKYVGLDANDENIERFREVNNIRLNEIFRIKKGRKIKYYI